MPKMSNSRNYTVKLGDTPYSIAKKHGINLTDLTKINTKIPTYSPGVVVTIPSVTSAVTTPKLTTSTAAPDTAATYTPPHEPMTGYEPPSGGNLRNLGTVLPGWQNWILNFGLNDPNNPIAQMGDISTLETMPLSWIAQYGLSDSYLTSIGFVKVNGVWVNQNYVPGGAAPSGTATTVGNPQWWGYDTYEEFYKNAPTWKQSQLNAEWNARNRAIASNTYVYPGETYSRTSNWAGGGGHTTFHYNTITNSGGGGRGGRHKGKRKGGGNTPTPSYNDYSNGNTYYYPSSRGLITWRY